MNTEIVRGYRYKKIRKGASKVEYSTPKMLEGQTVNREKMVGKIGIKEWNALETLCLDCYVETSERGAAKDWNDYKRIVSYRCERCSSYVEVQ